MYPPGTKSLSKRSPGETFCFQVPKGLRRVRYLISNQIFVYSISQYFLVLIDYLQRNIVFEGKLQFTSKLQTLSYELPASSKSTNNHRDDITIHHQKSCFLFFNLDIFASVSVNPLFNLESRIFLPTSNSVDKFRILIPVSA